MVTRKRLDGRLPQMPSARAWAGDGSGAACVLCEIPIQAGQVEYEVEWHKGIETQLLRFHERCYRLCNEA